MNKWHSDVHFLLEGYAACRRDDVEDIINDIHLEGKQTNQRGILPE